jgi:hypothetical protein
VVLGYQFNPRPAGLPDQRFWRIDRHADYGPLDGLARHRVNAGLICEQWEDILRVAGSLSTGTVRASELLRVLQGGGRPTRLGRAIAELGRIAKTLHLLSWIDSEQLRREMGVGLNRHESRHSEASVVTGAAGLLLHADERAKGQRQARGRSGDNREVSSRRLSQASCRSGDAAAHPDQNACRLPRPHSGANGLASVCGAVVELGAGVEQIPPRREREPETLPFLNVALGDVAAGTCVDADGARDRRTDLTGRGMRPTDEHDLPGQDTGPGNWTAQPQMLLVTQAAAEDVLGALKEEPAALELDRRPTDGSERGWDTPRDGVRRARDRPGMSQQMATRGLEAVDDRRRPGDQPLRARSAALLRQRVDQRRESGDRARVADHQRLTVKTTP